MKKNNKGFTLMEMLIVVAIIAILVAISIPVFSAQLEKARENTDIANLRAAKACAVTAYLTEDTTLKQYFGQSGKMFYDAVNGKIVTDSSGLTYGKGTGTDGGCEKYGTYEGSNNVKDSYITVDIGTDGTVTVAFVVKTST